MSDPRPSRDHLGMNAIRVIVLRVGQAPVVETIPADVEGDGHLKAMQALVGGYIECVGNFDRRGADLWCNEEGVIIGLPLNRAIPIGPDAGWFIHGDFFIARATPQGDLADVTDADIAHYTNLFASIDARTAYRELTEALARRSEYIAKGECLPAPYGCGGPATEFRDELSIKEYKITAQCQACQDRVYDTLAEEPVDEQGRLLS